MAIDTAAKRYSAMNPLARWRGPAVLPTGVMPVSKRAGAAGAYSGLNFGATYTLLAQFGSFAFTGQDAILTTATHINTAAKRFAAMNMGNPWRGINAFPSGSIGREQRYILGGFYSGFATGPTYTLTAMAGTFVWDGQPSFSDFEISCTAGTFAMTGLPASLIATRTLFATAGVFTMTGNDANLLHFNTRTLTATAGSFVMTGNDAVLTRPRTLTASAGSFAMLGGRMSLVWADAHGVVKTGQQITQWGGRKVTDINDDLDLLAIAAQVLINQKRK